jgi:hypothetical protein
MIRIVSHLVLVMDTVDVVESGHVGSVAPTVWLLDDFKGRLLERLRR